jgi:DtxR family Mn-dependent transcriptional regulator
MSHHRELADYEVEHLAAEVWLASEGQYASIEELRKSTRVADVDQTLERLVERRLARLDGSRVRLTSVGREMAEEQVRQRRLAELLFSTVLDVSEDRLINSTACVMEHVLNPEVTDSVCSFLGHPKFCPHGKPIPPGRCCRSFSNAVEPLVQPLRRLGVGESGRIAYIVPKDPERLVKLSNLGVVPGADVRLTQKQPATVITIGETTLAVDQDIAEEIYVKRLT